MELENIVAFAHDPSASYPKPPFSPSQSYPEYPFKDIASTPNRVYDLVRTSFLRLGLDAENQGSSWWNPLGEIVRPGDSVVIKPNWVLHRNGGTGGLDSVATHPSVVRAILDYLFLALKGEGTVVVGDAPLQSCLLNHLHGTQNWDSLPQFFSDNSSMKIELDDWRLDLYRGTSPLVFTRTGRSDDDRFVIVDMGKYSSLEPVSHDYRNFRVTNYDPSVLISHHQPGTHQYCISRTFLEADVIFNVPKLKTHKKAGITGCLKNLVGINGHKSYLPHHRRGPSTQGHDEYPCANRMKELHTRVTERFDLARNPAAQFLFAAAAYCLRSMTFWGDGIREGSWHGNDTLWRTILDINQVAVYADKTGLVRKRPQRRMFCLVDAVVSGEGEGPLCPDEKRTGAVLAGLNPLAVELATAKLMGFDHRAIPLLEKALQLEAYPLFTHELTAICLVSAKREPLKSWSPNITRHSPPRGWRQSYGRCRRNHV
jgi:uncharacterized protein (DUF362 family)